MLGRPLSKEARKSCLGVMSPPDTDPEPPVPKGNLLSNRVGQPLPDGVSRSSFARLTPESFQGLR